MQDRELNELRNYKVVKANDIVQKSRFNLQVQEQKIILYLISKIKPEDMNLKEHHFQIRDFCLVCGLDADNGKNYQNIRQTLKDLRDKSIWITLENGFEEITLSWFDYIKINKNNGAVSIKISEMMKPYLLQLREKYTQYELLYTLAMKSGYSLRLYEILKSYEYQHSKIFDIDELRRLLSAENYMRFGDFKRRVIEVALPEINAVSDLMVTYELIKNGRRVDQIKFKIKLKKDLNDKASTWKRIDQKINPEKKKNPTIKAKRPPDIIIEPEPTEIVTEPDEKAVKEPSHKKPFSFLGLFTKKKP